MPDTLQALNDACSGCAWIPKGWGYPVSKMHSQNGLICTPNAILSSHALLCGLPFRLRSVME